ncbi:uncharacterized protein TEOVI_000517500 [Trypanosoma equiperdum]|uniref:Variant surface glycoprotein (VSG) n=1 Tax=Trypanosoma equiperdum TaxID=5694 RepID=A0A1G4I7M9_TRYEQ|nr:hypothetical protein TEOVI_000517500 [Trypanosoma equiperdum]
MLVPDSTFLTPEYDIVVAGVGNVGTGGQLTQYKGAACAQAADSSLAYGTLARALGIKSISKKQKPSQATVKQQLYVSADGTGGCVEAAPETQSHLQTQKKVANTICQHKATTIKIVERPIQKSKATLASEGNMRALSQLLTKGKVNTKEEPNIQTEAVKALLPAGESALTADLVDPLATEEITHDKDNNPVKTMIKDANKPGKFGTTLAFCFGRQQRRKSAITAQKEVSDAKTEKKCKPDTEETKCKEDKDCEYSDGKCKVKEGVKVEKAATETNTTGSNSFVINKAPLLLSVLLF